MHTASAVCMDALVLRDEVRQCMLALNFPNRNIEGVSASKIIGGVY